jgi:hypothetical protein
MCHTEGVGLRPAEAGQRIGVATPSSFPGRPFRGTASQLAVAGRLAPRARHGRSDREARFTRMRCGKPSCDVPGHSLAFGIAIA